ncbi:hypothetical protein CARUB_v10019220mg [Capsella rubella]|uniref:Uncharacterized protein n=1 Tax=Capsella rubella TaxID=81985 RepID=R0FLH7_9BRAS|nr:hypothetical protein CARUB_v10019220mg [Capsella rubella]
MMQNQDNETSVKNNTTNLIQENQSNQKGNDGKSLFLHWMTGPSQQQQQQLWGNHLILFFPSEQQESTKVELDKGPDFRSKLVNKKLQLFPAPHLPEFQEFHFQTKTSSVASTEVSLVEKPKCRTKTLVGFLTVSNNIKLIDEKVCVRVTQINVLKDDEVDSEQSRSSACSYNDADIHEVHFFLCIIIGMTGPSQQQHNSGKNPLDEYSEDLAFLLQLSSNLTRNSTMKKETGVCILTSTMTQIFSRTYEVDSEQKRSPVCSYNNNINNSNYEENHLIALRVFASDRCSEDVVFMALEKSVENIANSTKLVQRNKAIKRQS